MRELKDYSIKDNLSYLKAEYGQLYSALVDMVGSSTKRFIQIQDKVDDAGDFNSVLTTVKAHVPNGLLIKCPDSKLVYGLSRDNLKVIMDIFESMFLDVLDLEEFNALDPELQELYYEAQAAIDEEEEKGERL